MPGRYGAKLAHLTSVGVVISNLHRAQLHISYIIKLSLECIIRGQIVEYPKIETLYDQFENSNLPVARSRPLLLARYSDHAMWKLKFQNF